MLQGRFRLDRQIGRGGFARVFLATDQTLHRQVAIKILNPELLAEADEHDFLARFRQEARSVAALEHPNILGVYDYGEAEGIVYLVMPYIEGGTLFTRLAGGRALAPEEAGSYLRQAAAALDYAHRRNIVHRDIKPQNMLLRVEDNRLLLADFGIAKVITGTSRQSQTGVIGTLAYMAPEQLQGQVGRSTDIYALGCVLFQMLTGQLPFSGTTEQLIYSHLSSTIPSVTELSRGRVPGEVQPIIERALAKRPDYRFASAGELAAAYAAAIGVTAPHFQTQPPNPNAPPPFTPPGPPQVPTNLPHLGHDAGATIAQPPPISGPVAYGQGQTIGGPISNPHPYTGGQTISGPVGGTISGPVSNPISGPIGNPISNPISAPVPPPHDSARYYSPPAPYPPQPPAPVPPQQIPFPPAPPARRQSSRAFIFGIAGALLFLLVIAGAVVLRGLGIGGAEATATPVLAGNTGQATATAAIAAVPSAAPSPGPSAATATAVTPAASGAPPGAASAPPSAAPSSPPTASATVAAVPSAAPSSAPTVPPRSPLAGTTVATFTGHADDVRGLAWTADGGLLYSGGADGTVRFWRPDGTLLNTISGRTFAVTSVALSPDGATLAVGSDDHKVHLWRADGTPLAIMDDHGDNVVSVAWSPDGTMLASASNDKTARIWTATGQPIRTLAGHGDVVQSVAWSPDGRMLATASWDKTVRLWRLDGSLLATLTGHTDQVYAVAWSPDGKTVASGSRDGTVRLWTAAGQPLRTLTGHTSFVSSLAWSPDGKTLASGAFDKTVRLWAADGTPLATLAGHTDAVTCLAWFPDGSSLASGSWDDTIRLWK